MRRRTLFVHEYVTGGGLAGQDLPDSLAVEGNAMRRAIAEDVAALGDRFLVRMTLDARLPNEPGPWEVVRVGPGEEIATLRRLAEESDDALLIAPETGDILAQRASLLIGGKARYLGSTPAAIVSTADKPALCRHLAREGIATVGETELIFDPGDFPDSFPYPAVLKPLDGAGRPTRSSSPARAFAPRVRSRTCPRCSSRT